MKCLAKDLKPYKKNLSDLIWPCPYVTRYKFDNALPFSLRRLAFTTNPVVAGQAVLRPLADQRFPFESEELHQIYRIGLELLIAIGNPPLLLSS